MKSRRTQSIQDPVHGLMQFQGMETAVVEVLRAKELQRLRRLRQLGLAHLVYPGAEHSRLVHSIGVAYLSIRFLKRIIDSSRGFLCPALLPNDSAIRDIALAALVHDLGHGPFSHTWEHDVIGDLTAESRNAWCHSLGLGSDDALKNLKWHELVTQGLLAWSDGDINKLLENQEAGTCQRIRRLLLNQYYLPFLPALISSDIDVDRCDFMLRDSFMTGVPYGKFDLDWLISNVSVGQNESQRLVIGFESRKTLRGIEEFILARRAMYDVVYYHRAVKSAETMLGLVMQRLRDLCRSGNIPSILEQTPFESVGKLLRGEALEPHEILSLDDSLIWTLIQAIADSQRMDETVSELSKWLVNRVLFKAVPCKIEKINRFLIDKDAHNKIKETLQRVFIGKDVKYYYQIVSCPISLINEKSAEQGYFVDSSDPARRASPLRDHPLLRTWVNQTPQVYLFAPEAAREQLVQLLHS